MERLEPHDEVVQRAAFAVKEHHGQPAVVRVQVIGGGKRRRLLAQRLAKVLKLQKLAQPRPVAVGGQLGRNLRRRARVVAAVGQKRVRRGAQHAVLVKQRVAVQAIGETVAHAFDALERQAVVLLHLGGLGALGPVLVDVHILVGLA